MKCSTSLEFYNIITLYTKQQTLVCGFSYPVYSILLQAGFGRSFRDVDVIYQSCYIRHRDRAIAIGIAVLPTTERQSRLVQEVYKSGNIGHCNLMIHTAICISSYAAGIATAAVESHGVIGV